MTESERRTDRIDDSPMRVVIDTNSLETHELRVFLKGDRTNLAVLSEHTVAEIFKPSDLHAVFASLSILREFPDQILMLHGNRHAAKVDPRTGAISNQFVDRATTRSMPSFFRMLRTAQAGDEGYLRQLRARQSWARERADRVELALGDQADTLSQLRSMFTEDDLKRLRTNQELSERSRGLILWVTRSVAETMAKAQPTAVRVPGSPRRYDAFVWRYALCYVIQLMRLLSKGATRRAPAKARNDHFDNVFATFGTYFNGVMSNDTDQLATHAIARVILKALGVRLAVDYIESHYILTLIDQRKEGRPSDV